MPRSGPVKKRQLPNDPIYKSRLVTRFINRVMKGGKKDLAKKVIYGALEQLGKDRKEQLTVFETAVRNVIPKQEVRTRRVGGATYQVPVSVKHDRGEALAIRWIIDSARARKGKPMIDRLADELENAAKDEGDAIKKRDNTYKMAEANRAFAHFRW